MICYLTKQFVVIQIPPRKIKKKQCFIIYERYLMIIIPVLAYNSEHSKVKLEGEETRKS